MELFSGRTWLPKVWKHGVDSEHLRRAVLIHQYLVISISVVLFGIVYYLLLGSVSNFPYSFALLVFLLVCLLLNLKGYPILAFHLQAGVINFMIFIFNLGLGKEGLTFLFYFPLIMSLVMIFNDRKTRFSLFVHLGLTLFLAFLSMFLVFKGWLIDLGLDSSAKASSPVFNSVFSLIIMIVLVNLFAKSNLRNQEKLRRIIRDKEVLIAEVHHRVKNNLAIMSGLLNLQKNLITDNFTREVLEDSRNRISSMALIHEKLYKNPTFSYIDISSYIRSLFEDLEKSFSSATEVNVQLDLENINIGIDQAIPCGLILNELITNSYKHAFKGRNKGLIRKKKKKTGEEVLSVYKHDGVGVNNVETLKDSESLGITVITSLSDQLDGKWSFSNEPGFCFRLKFLVKKT